MSVGSLIKIESEISKSEIQCNKYQCFLQDAADTACMCASGRREVQCDTSPERRPKHRSYRDRRVPSPPEHLPWQGVSQVSYIIFYTP